jgi:integrase/recombinase XerD
MANCWAACARSTAMAKNILLRGRSGSPRGRAVEQALIGEGFGAYLRGLGYSAFSINRYQRRLAFLADWLRSHRCRRRLNNLNRHLIPGLLKEILPGRSIRTIFLYRQVLRHWLRYQGRFHAPTRRTQWRPWLDNYLDFLQSHRGVGISTVEHCAADVEAFLRWQFGRGTVAWSSVTAEDIRDFAGRRVRGVKPIYAKARLGRLRRFLTFVHMRGACSAQLMAAVPKIATRPEARRPEILSSTQCRELLRSFPRSTPEGRRDYAMTLCMLELGLRGVEVISLRMQDVHWRERRLSVPATKTGRGRELPIPDRVLAALQKYVGQGRPEESRFDFLFLRHPRRSGQPLTRHILKQTVERAYRRCGFPRSWYGTHRLRHTFATRLHRSGASVKPIADLLGHRKYDSTTIYTRIECEELRPLVRPWPAR